MDGHRFLELHRQLVLGELCLSGAAHAAARPLPDADLERLAATWGVEMLDADARRVASSVAVALGRGDPRLLDALAAMACRAHPDARELLLRVSARMVEHLAQVERARFPAPTPPAERWLEACRKELATTDVDVWRRRLEGHREAAREERRITLGAAFRRRMTPDDHAARPAR